MNNTIYGATTTTPIPMNTSGNGNYVEKFDGSNKPNEEAFTVYGQNMGQEVNIHYSPTPKSGALAQYNDRGSLTVEAPQSDWDIANKGYVDNKFAATDFITIVDALPEDGESNKIYLVPKAESQTQDLFDEYLWINGAWEWITTKQVEVNLDEYMKKATNKCNPYVHKAVFMGGDGSTMYVNTDTAYGLTPVKNGEQWELRVVSSSKSEINAKQEARKPIVPSTLDYAVKVGLTTNNETLTDEEKASALEWLGVKKYVDDAIAALKAELQG